MDEDPKNVVAAARLNVLQRELSSNGVRSVLLDLDVWEPDGTRSRRTFSISMTMDLLTSLGLWFSETAAMARALGELPADDPSPDQVPVVSEVRILAGPLSPVAVLEAEPDGLHTIRLGVPYPQLLDLRTGIEAAMSAMTHVDGYSH
jgi:hypothetical protein